MCNSNRAGRPRYNPAMRRLARWVLNAVRVLSVLLCGGTAVLWVRSYRVASAVAWSPDGRPWSAQLTVERGGMAASVTRFPAPSLSSSRGLSVDTWPATTYYVEWERPAFQVVALHAAGFGYDHAWVTRIVDFRVATAPLAAIAVLFAALPAARWRKAMRRSSRARRHCCRACTYDLTGHVSGVCPECGTKVGAPTHA